jgi:hypothetical protein
MGLLIPDKIRELIRRDALVKGAPKAQDLIAIPCRCDPPRAHGPHYVRVERLARGGDLAGRVKVDKDAAQHVSAFEHARRKAAAQKPDSLVVVPRRKAAA